MQVNIPYMDGMVSLFMVFHSIALHSDFLSHISELYRRGHDGIRGVPKGRGIMTTSSCSKCWNRVPVHTQVSASVAHSAPVWAVWDDLIVRKSLQHNWNIGTLMFKHWKLLSFYTFTKCQSISINQTVGLHIKRTNNTQIFLLGACCLYLKSWGLSRFQSGKEVNPSKVNWGDVTGTSRHIIS